MRRVRVNWWKGAAKHEVATLSEREDGAVALQWSESYLDSDIELSPFSLRKAPGVILMPHEPFSGVYGLFNDHVPDGFGRRLLRRAFDRQGLQTTEITPLDALQYIGERGMGALSFEPALHPDERWAGHEVDLDELSAAIEPILSGTPSAVIDEFIAGGASPNGMRPKFLARIKDGVFYVGAGDEVKGEDWLIKFPAEVDPPDIAKVEYAYYKMAKSAGLEIALCKLFKGKRTQYFGTKRFDRERSERLHMHTLSGLLNVDPRNMGISYENFATVAKRITGEAKELEKVFRIAAFNIYSCNQDDHIKNVAFLMDKNGSWRVAPAYDLTFNRTRYGEHKMTLGNSGKPAEKDILSFGKTIGIKPARVKELNEEVKYGVSRFKYHAKNIGLSKATISKISTELDMRLKKERGRTR